MAISIIYSISTFLNIINKTVAGIAVAGDSVRDGVTNGASNGATGYFTIVTTKGLFKISSKLSLGFFGNNGDNTGGGIFTVNRALRSAQYFYPLNSDKIINS